MSAYITSITIIKEEGKDMYYIHNGQKYHHNYPIEWAIDFNHKNSPCCCVIRKECEYCGERDINKNRLKHNQLIKQYLNDIIAIYEEHKHDIDFFENDELTHNDQVIKSLKNGTLCIESAYYDMCKINNYLRYQTHLSYEESVICANFSDLLLKKN
jgi:hypothetical protein